MRRRRGSIQTCPLMTTNVEIGLDAAAVFQALTKGETVEESGHLLVAPKCLQNRILDMIQEEIDPQEERGGGLHRPEAQLADG